MTSIPSINDSKRLVIKVGSSLLLKKNEFHFNWLDSLIDDIIFLRKKKNRISFSYFWCRLTRKKIFKFYQQSS